MSQTLNEPQTWSYEPVGWVNREVPAPLWSHGGSLSEFEASERKVQKLLKEISEAFRDFLGLSIVGWREEGKEEKEGEKEERRGRNVEEIRGERSEEMKESQCEEFGLVWGGWGGGKRRGRRRWGGGEKIKIKTKKRMFNVLEVQEEE